MIQRYISRFFVLFLFSAIRLLEAKIFKTIIDKLAKVYVKVLKTPLCRLYIVQIHALKSPSKKPCPMRKLGDIRPLQLSVFQARLCTVSPPQRFFYNMLGPRDSRLGEGWHSKPLCPAA